MTANISLMQTCADKLVKVKPETELAACWVFNYCLVQAVQVLDFSFSAQLEQGWVNWIADMLLPKSEVCGVFWSVSSPFLCQNEVFGLWNKNSQYMEPCNEQIRMEHLSDYPSHSGSFQMYWGSTCAMKKSSILKNSDPQQVTRNKSFHSRDKRTTF